MEKNRFFLGKLFYSCIVGLLLLGSGCKDALQEEVFSFLSTENFYKTPADAEAAVVAAYAPFVSTDYYRYGYYNLTLLADDQVTIGRNPQFQAIDNFDIPADHPFVRGTWQQMYSCINRSNTGLARIPGIAMNEELKNELLAECYFIRAFNYFNLVRLFGAVPLTTDEINSADKVNSPKASVQQVYKQITDDLLKAESALPVTRAGVKVGRATRGAAKTLLADVYLTMENWAGAASKAKEVIDLNSYALLDNFNSVFSVSNENNKEIIFSIQFDGVNIGNSLASYAHAGGTDNPNTGNGVQVWSVDQKSDMWLNWNLNDSRRTFSVYDKFINRAGNEISVYNTSRPFPAFGKYNAPNEVSGINCPFNPIVYRYADVLLIYAEALSQENGGPNAAALEALNQVKRRAYKRNINVISDIDYPAGSDKEAFRKLVLLERSYEFVVENRRIFDLMRTRQFPQIIKQLGKPTNPTATLFPIPLAEIETNKALSPADQNLGY